VPTTLCPGGIVFVGIMLLVMNPKDVIGFMNLKDKYPEEPNT
jgi:hypothetical protein